MKKLIIVLAFTTLPAWPENSLFEEKARLELEAARINDNIAKLKKEEAQHKAKAEQLAREMAEHEADSKKKLAELDAIGQPAPAQGSPTPVYKCKSTTGKITFQKKPCDRDMNEAVIKTTKPTPAEDSGNGLGHGMMLGDFSVKESEQSSDYQYFSYKVMVSNRTNKEQKVALKYQAIDGEGYEVGTVWLQGTIQPQSYEILTETSIMEKSKYFSINKWVLKK